MKAKKMSRRVLKIITIILVVFSIITWGYIEQSMADVGSFESYSSGGSSFGSSGWGSSSSDWGSSSSSWGSGSSSWSSGSSGRKSGSDYSDSNYRIGSNAQIDSVIYTITLIFVIFIITLIISYISAENRKRRNKDEYTQIRNHTIFDDGPDRSSILIEKIHEHDPNFNPDQFKSYVRDVFVKLQNAWTERDWEKIRVFESNELFEQHKAQLDGYINNNQINVMDRICINWVRLISYEESGEKEIITATINSRMADYIIDATTKDVIKGQKNIEYTNTYVMQFIRTKGVRTSESENKINTTNCPNCGAPTKIMTSGRCEYCNSVITTTNHDWVLNSLERKG